METNFSVSEVIEKIQSAGCLTEAELQLVSSMLAEVSVRRQIDILDAQWERDVHRFVGRRRKGRRLSLVSTQGSVFGTLIGACLVAYGAYMLWQYIMKPADLVLPAVFFSGAILVGIWTIASCLGGMHLVREYAAECAAYRKKRRQLTEQLPAEGRLPYSLCPNCLAEQWRMV